MAYIEGLKESEQALAEIKKILKELEGINTFMSVENPTAMYKLSFTVKHTDFCESDETEPHKHKKIATKYITPLICDNKDSLHYFVQLYKDRKVRTVRQLMDSHRICLSEEELAILENPSQV